MTLQHSACVYVCVTGMVYRPKTARAFRFATPAVEKGKKLQVNNTHRRLPMHGMASDAAGA